METIMQTTVMSSAVDPTEATRSKLRPAPVSTMVTGMTRRARPLALSMTGAGSGIRLRTSTPATMATMAALTG
jgi:hypothetical protein